MIRYELRAVDVIVSVNSSNPNTSAAIAFQGAPEKVERVRSRLSLCSGAFGHLIGESTTPIDLHAAMNQPEMQQYLPVLVQGTELVQNYDPDIPGDSVT